MFQGPQEIIIYGCYHDHELGQGWMYNIPRWVQSLSFFRSHVLLCVDHVSFTRSTYLINNIRQRLFRLSYCSMYLTTPESNPFRYEKPPSNHKRRRLMNGGKRVVAKALKRYTDVYGIIEGKSFFYLDFKENFARIYRSLVEAHYGANYVYQDEIAEEEDMRDFIKVELASQGSDIDAPAFSPPPYELIDEFMSCCSEYGSELF